MHMRPCTPLLLVSSHMLLPSNPGKLTAESPQQSAQLGGGGGRTGKDSWVQTWTCGKLERDPRNHPLHWVPTHILRSLGFPRTGPQVLEEGEGWGEAAPVPRAAFLSLFHIIVWDSRKILFKMFSPIKLQNKY